MSANFLETLPQELRSKVEKITAVIPNSLPIFEELYNYGLSQTNELSHKKPKGEQVTNKRVDSANVIFKLDNASVLSPLRKKLDFVFHLSESDKQPVISLLKDGNIEYTIADLKNNISMAAFLPIPEKSNMVYLFLECRTPGNTKYADPILLTLSKSATLLQFQKMGIIPNSEKDFKKCIDYMRKQAILTGFRIIDPFSNNTNAQEKLKSFYVACHRGTKEGMLYFLPDHILFGFKKPILLFKSTDIVSITYSSITRLTFNVTLITKDEQKYEFSMIDQTEYAKIDEYVKMKEVTDKSMSEELKATKALKRSQQNEGESILKEAEAQISGQQGTSIADIPNDSDDEENDQDFQAESDLSDGSDRDEEDESDDDTDGNGSDEAEEVDEEEDEGDIEEIGNNIADVEIPEDSFKEEPLADQPSNELPTMGSLEDIAVEVDDDDDDDDDDGSGVEYD